MNVERLQKFGYRLELQSLHLDYLIALSEIDSRGALLPQMIEAYREIAPKMLKDVEVSIRLSDYKTTGEQLAVIEAASQRVGAYRLAELCRFLMRERDLDLSLSDRLLHLSYITAEFAKVNRDLDTVTELITGKTIV